MGRATKSAATAAKNDSNPAAASLPNPASPKVKYRNLRYGCKLCPQSQFSQLAAGHKRNRQSAVESHIRTCHPEVSVRWKRLAYRWGHRVYYDNQTSIDEYNPKDFASLEPGSLDEGSDVVLDQTGTSGYVYADGQEVDGIPQPIPKITAEYPPPRSFVTVPGRRRTPEDDISGHRSQGRHSHDEDETVSDIDGSHPELSAAGFVLSRLEPLKQIHQEEARFVPQYASEVARETRSEHEPDQFPSALLVPSVQLKSQHEPARDPRIADSLTPQQHAYAISQGTTLSYPTAASPSLPNPGNQDQVHGLSSYHRPPPPPSQQQPVHEQPIMLSPFDTEVLHGRYGPELASMAQLLFLGPPFEGDPTSATQKPYATYVPLFATYKEDLVSREYSFEGYAGCPSQQWD